MTRFVIGPDVALYLARGGAAIADEHQLVAPTLLRSQVLSLLYQSVRRGELTQADADRQLDYLRGLRIRLLGDRVLQRAAWRLAEQLGWEDTLDAEYVALTQLQADAFVTLDAGLAMAVQELVTIAEPPALLARAAAPEDGTVPPHPRGD
ncbi:type II toxin-antitoxin system VapC family toxin [Arthrobacter sp. ES3-54]|jgi:predicted nucleic acid-binding protein|uniref:type II toxin-antitoxin system VapC family toxin n=1 Tax=Arthrobacter sp. ES3-54 TaxID=1502991 RepID=UPI002404D9AB|nr:type II toxin-antitoxin system VapC family toxin [Arthrobacter sp. ES3-54]MDF9749393.1 putative nucleic acid-binding protein [Arthrobacter sp. ES3-54]